MFYSQFSANSTLSLTWDQHSDKLCLMSTFSDASPPPPPFTFVCLLYNEIPASCYCYYANVSG